MNMFLKHLLWTWRILGFKWIHVQRSHAVTLNLPYHITPLISYAMFQTLLIIITEQFGLEVTL